MKNPETTLAGDDATVSEVVRQYSPKFSRHGFQFTELTLENSQLLGVNPVFHFRNTQTGMEIRISFFAAREGRNGGFNAMFINSQNHKLQVEDYLKLNGRKGLAGFFTYRDPMTDICMFAESFFNMLVELLNTDLQPIIEGKTFEETPIDWMGYR